MKTQQLRAWCGLLTWLLAFGPMPRTEAADAVTEPFPGVRYVHRHVSAPREIDMHIVAIDLNRPGVTIKTSAANGDRPGECDLETTRAFVQRSTAQIGINSGFFSRTAEEWRLGVADLSSLAVSDGSTRSPSTAAARRRW